MKTSVMHSDHDLDQNMFGESNSNQHISLAREALFMQANAVHSLGNRLDESFDLAVEQIIKCSGRVVVCGMGKSGLVGKKIVATLASTGTPSFYLHPAEAFHGDLGMLVPNDLIIVISYSGETEEVVKLIPSLKQFRNKIIAFTSNKKSTLARNADIWLDISVEREVCPNNLAPTTSTLVTMALGDAIAVALIEARKFLPMDFARFHPGGSLGRRLLTRVKDVMNKSLPVVDTKATVRECLFTMTRHRMGIVLVMTNQVLHGILTDGDLRRALLKNENAQEKNVTKFYQSKPITIDENASIESADEIMQEKKVRALIVTEGIDNKVCGIYEIFG